MLELSLKEKRIIEEETENLKTLQSMSLLSESEEEINHRQIYRQEILSLNQAASQGAADDRAQLDGHINRLEILSQRAYQTARSDLDLKNPYFAHIKLKESKKTRDLYIGNQVFYLPRASIQIIDWKTSPISTIYFLYEEGDPYEEEIESRWFEGTVEVKRQLKISNGEVTGIRQGDLILKKIKGDWTRIAEHYPLLKGGAGAAARPENTFKNFAGFQTSNRQTSTANTSLSELTALVDREQYKVITRSPDDIVAVQGVAGSGKTTASLHRIAWLTSRHPQRFPETSVMIMAFNKSLVAYISKSLPYLGLSKIKTARLEDWFSKQRQRLFSGHLPTQYSSQTPSSAVIFKKHPALLKIIDGFINEKEASFNQELKQILKFQENTRLPVRHLSSKPLITRVFTIYEWVAGDKKPDRQGYAFSPELKSLLQRLVNKYVNPEKSKIEMVILYWEELFSDFQYLKEKFLALTDDISPSSLEEAVSWLKKQYTEKRVLSSPEPDVFETMSARPQKQHKGKSKESRLSWLDYEDNPTLLYLYQKLLKPIADKRKIVKYSHLMIDEAQDLSVIELATLLNVCQKPYSITLAGDVNQKTVENSYQNWGLIFEDLNIKEQKISTLKVGYRSTRQIMEFAFSILDDSIEQNFIAKRDGPPVTMLRFYSQGELIYFLAGTLRKLIGNEPQASAALICLTPSEAKENYNLLKKLEIPRLRLVSDQNFSFNPGVDVTDVKQVKGLEFDYVALLNVDEVNYPSNKHSAHLLHIAATRAAHQLWIMNSRAPSPLLPQWLVDNQRHNF